MTIFFPTNYPNHMLSQVEASTLNIEYSKPNHPFISSYDFFTTTPISLLTKHTTNSNHSLLQSIIIPPLQMQCSSSSMEFPTSPLLKLSFFSASHFDSPTTTPFSPPNSCLSIMHTPSSQSCFQPIQDSSLDHFKSSSPTELPPCSIHVNSPDANSCMHELDSDTNLEIVDELRKAQARVRFLKKKLRQRGVSDLLKQTSRKQHLLSKSPREKLMVRRMLRRKDDISEQEDLQERDESESGECVQGSIDSEMATHGENQESKTSMKIGLERGEEEEDSTDKIFKMKNSETSQGSMDLLNHLSSQYNVIAPRSNMWDCKQCILQGRCSNECTSMEGFGSESSTHLPDLEGHLFGQKSQTDDPFSSKRHILIDVSAPIYSQSTATALAKPRNELSYLQSGTEYFKCSFEQDFSEQGLIDSDLAAESVLHELDLLLHRNTAADAVECSDLVSKPIDVHEHLGCQHFSLQTSGEHSAETQVCQSSFIQHNYHEADLLGSSYPESKQITEHQNSAEKSSKLCVSDLLLHHPLSASVMHSRYVAAGFEHECARAEHYSVLTSVGGFCGGGCTSREETWKQEPFDEQRLMEADNLWAEDQFIFQDETFSLDRFDFTCLPRTETMNQDVSKQSSGGSR